MSASARQTGWLPAALAVAGSLFGGVGGGGIVVWQYPRLAPDGIGEVSLLRNEVAALRGEVQNTREAAGEAERRIKLLETAIEEAKKLSLSCCTPKRR